MWLPNRDSSGIKPAITLEIYGEVFAGERTVEKSMIRSKFPPNEDRDGVAVLPPVPFGIGLVLGALVQFLWEPLAFFPVTWIGHVAGWPLVVASIILVIWARQTMARSGVSLNVYKPTNSIVVSGPYGFTRNPMYLSMTLLYFGISLIINAVWPVLFLPAVLAVVHYGVIAREERYLERKFGQEYQRYRSGVRRWL